MYSVLENLERHSQIECVVIIIVIIPPEWLHRKRKLLKCVIGSACHTGAEKSLLVFGKQVMEAR